eukprot:TRINITY_DN799_c0_g2_i1.p1 TRINITY_DN799_c0_g2~~TRINITY_DN799_c0_g2_i1.p1  ORF type:complete len:281 (-),score=105.82 TRINITY_DN799_c0_g2_i1:144-986(-)
MTKPCNNQDIFIRSGAARGMEARGGARGGGAAAAGMRGWEHDDRDRMRGWGHDDRGGDRSRSPRGRVEKMYEEWSKGYGKGKFDDWSWKGKGKGFLMDWYFGGKGYDAGFGGKGSSWKGAAATRDVYASFERKTDKGDRKGNKRGKQSKGGSGGPATASLERKIGKGKGGGGAGGGGGGGRKGRDEVPSEKELDSALEAYFGDGEKKVAKPAGGKGDINAKALDDELDKYMQENADKTKSAGILKEDAAAAKEGATAAAAAPAAEEAAAAPAAADKTEAK